MKLLKNNYFYFLLLTSIFFIGNPAKFPADDGFFYPQIAYNIVNNGFMGLNTLYLTNGFHPLWMVICVIAEFVNPFGKEGVLYILWLFQIVFIVCGFRLLDKAFFKNFLLSKIVNLGVIVTLFFSLGTLYLTEAHLSFVTLSFLLYYLCKEYNNSFVFGVICSLVFLTRLDLIFVIFTLSLLFWSKQKWHFLSLMKIIFGFSIFSIPYLVSNQLLFGDIIPISGKIKSYFPIPQLNFKLGFISKITLFIGVFYLLFLSFQKQILYRNVKIFFVIGSLCHLIYNILFQSQIGQWYYVTEFIFCILFINDLIQKFNFNFLQNLKFNFSIFICLLFIVSIIGALKLRTSMSLGNNVLSKASKFESKNDDLVQLFAKKLTSTLPNNARVFTYDFPGKLAFYSNLNIIPADGLVGNKIYFEEIERPSFLSYLKKNNIKYVILPSHMNNNEDMYFIGIVMKYNNGKTRYYIKNSLTKKIVDSTSIQLMRKTSSFENPIKTWQPQYDSISIFTYKNY